jgi:hypothetical protein
MAGPVFWEIWTLVMFHVSHTAAPGTGGTRETVITDGGWLPRKGS